MSELNYRYEANQKTLLMIDEMPGLDHYINEWFSYCESNSIEYGVPKIKADQIFEEFEELLWVPEIGLCIPHIPIGRWVVREPFARLGPHTDMIHFWRVHCVMEYDEINRSVVDYIEKTKSLRSYPRGSEEPGYRWCNRFPNENANFKRFLDKLTRRLEDEPLIRDSGVLCLFQVGMPKHRISRSTSKWMKRVGFYGHISASTDYDELLSIEIMKCAANKLYDSENFLFFQKPQVEAVTSIADQPRPWWDYDEWPY